MIIGRTVQPGSIASRAGFGALLLSLTASATCARPTPSVVFDEFCLRGEFDLSARLQGLSPGSGERYPTEWCVVSSVESERVHFSTVGRSNPDMEETFALAYLSSDRVRLVNADEPPDVEFSGTLAAEEASSLRRIDPHRLVAELGENPDWIVEVHDDGLLEVRWPGARALASVRIEDGRLRLVSTMADLPLRGRVSVVWSWTWSPALPDGGLEVVVDDALIFRATGARRTLTAAEAEEHWQPSGGEPPVDVPGRAWPTVTNINTETVQPGVHIVRGVRTGFHHLVVETQTGLVVADAPAGWVEVHRVPATDIVPGLGISGLSELFVDYLAGHWPGVPIRAVVLTHAHDDHAGGARAFAAAGAEIYAPAAVAGFLETALNGAEMPPDRLSASGQSVRVIGVDETVFLDDPERSVELMPMGTNPHVEAALGVHVPAAQVFFQSDLHVPNAPTSTPRADRLETDCWFAGWVAQALPPETIVHNSHGTVALGVDAVSGYLDNEACSG